MPVGTPEYPPSGPDSVAGMMRVILERTAPAPCKRRHNGLR